MAFLSLIENNGSAFTSDGNNFNSGCEQLPYQDCTLLLFKNITAGLNSSSCTNKKCESTCSDSSFVEDDEFCLRLSDSDDSDTTFSQKENVEKLDSCVLPDKTSEDITDFPKSNALDCCSDKDSGINPQFALIPKVVLAKLPESFLQLNSANCSTTNFPLVDAFGKSLDLLLQFCWKCRSFKTVFKNVFISKNCLQCNYPLFYMCTKCHDNYYVDYNNLIKHWLVCKNEKLVRDQLGSMISMPVSTERRPIEAKPIETSEKNLNCENDEFAQLFTEHSYAKHLSAEEVSNGVAFSLLPTVKIDLERLPETIVKLKRIIDDNDLIIVANVKSKDLSVYRNSVTRYCRKCKKTTIDTKKISLPKNCTNCSSLLQYVCNSCNENYFFNFSYMKEHLKFCKNINESDDFSIVFYRCTVCDFKTFHESIMASHLQITNHSIDDSNANTESAEAYDKSLFIRESPSVGILKATRRYCPKCGIFARKGYKVENCPACNIQLYYHCIKCGEKKTNRPEMYDHLLSKCNSIRYQCVLCDYTSSTWRSMRAHLERQHISGKFLCDYCGFRAKRKKILKIHIVNFHRDVDPNDNICGDDFDIKISST